MTRNLKTLGLGLVAALALSALTASIASAQNGRLTSDGPATLVGAKTGAASENALVAFGGETQCPNETWTLHKYNETPHVLVPNGDETVTITTHTGPCIALGLPATYDMNGCDWVTHYEGTSGVDQYATKMTTNCTGGNHVTLTIFSSAAKHTENKPFCHFTFTENATGYAGLSATDTTNGKIDMTGTITGLSIDKKSPTGSILCPEESTNTASMKVDMTLSGRNSLGEATSVGISHL